MSRRHLQFPAHALLLCALWLLAGAVAPAYAARFEFEPVSDQDDGELLDGVSWDAKLEHLQESDLFLRLGSRGTGEVYETSLAFRLNGFTTTEAPAEVRLRLNQQGGRLTSALHVRITAALDLDPLATPAGMRFSLPRTQQHVDWKIVAEWDSSGQRIAKYAETPDLSPLLEELLALPGWATSDREIVLFLEVPFPFGDNYVRFDDTHPAWTADGNDGIRPARLRLAESYRDAFWGQEFLCRPTPSSVEVNVIPHRVTLMFVQYGPDSSAMTNFTSLAAADTAQVAQMQLTGLQPDTRYFYRLRYRPLTQLTFEIGPIHSFVTMPEPGQEARLCVTTDIHVTNMEALGLWSTMNLLDDTLDYMQTHHPAGYHAWLDLGDLVVMRAQRVTLDLEEADQRYRGAREHIERLAGSVPFLLVRGNHEEVNGWDDDGSAQTSMAWSGQMLKKWFPPPLPDSYYSGNETPHPQFGLPGNYFAFTAGNLRIRCLDPYLFSMTRPHNGHGEVNGSEDPWDWSLGQGQYQWLRDDLEAHRTPYSLVFLHHLVTSYDEPNTWYGRGGVEVVDWAIAGRPTFEWGGQDAAGQDVFAQKRPGFAYGPVHELLSSFGNQVVAKGHDHFHGRQQLDEMTYLTIAKPDDDGTHTGNLWGWAGQTYYPPEVTAFYENSGFLSIVADSQGATYEYVKSFPASIRGTVADSFTHLPSETATAAGDLAPAVRGTWIDSVYPNPARIAPRIDFQLGQDTDEVALTVHDVTGRLVSEVFRGPLPAGRHTRVWNATDSYGRRAGAGVYFARLHTRDGRTDSVKLLLVR